MFNTLKILSTWLLILSMTACAQATDSKLLNTKTAKYTQADSKQVLGTLLTLIDSFHTSEDFNIAHFENITKIKLAPIKEAPQELHFNQDISTKWWYVYMLKMARNHSATIQFQFNTQGNYPKESYTLTDICQPDLDQFRKKLETMGYVLRRHIPELKPLYIYTRNHDQIWVEISARGGELYTSKGGCVYGVEISYNG